MSEDKAAVAETVTHFLSVSRGSHTGLGQHGLNREQREPHTADWDSHFTMLQLGFVLISLHVWHFIGIYVLVTQNYLHYYHATECGDLWKF